MRFEFKTALVACMIAVFFGRSALWAADVAAPQVSTLPNGLRVITKSDSGLGVVAINIVIRAGSAQEPPEDNGAAHFLEHMLFRGSAGYAPGEAEALIEGLGGRVNAGTLRDFTHIYATVPMEAFEEALAALADAVLRPTLETSEIERARGVLLGELVRSEEDARTRMWDLAHSVVMAGHPYSRPITGTKESVFLLGRSRLVAYHNRWYLPNNMAVIIVGDISAQRTLAAAGKSFGELKPGALSALPAKEAAQAKQREKIYYHDGNLAYVGLVVRAPGVDAARRVYAMDVLTALLGDGAKSRLQRKLLGDEPLALAVGAEFLTSREASPFLVWAACRPDRVEQTKRAITEEIDAIAMGQMTPAEVSGARRRLETSFWLANETYTDQADVLGFFEAIDTYRFSLSYVGGIRAINPIDVQGAARYYFAPEKRAWITLMPREGRAKEISARPHGRTGERR